MNVVRLRGVGATRKAWWFALIAFIISWPVAALVYESGLSSWLRRPSLGTTLGALVIIASGVTLLALVSTWRAADCGARPKQLLTALLVVTLPYWVVVLGLLPSASPASPTPYDVFTRRIRTGVIAALALLLVLLVMVGGVMLHAELNPTASLGNAGTEAVVAPFGDGDGWSSVIPRTCFGVAGPVPSSDPQYAIHLDADLDGFACE